MLGKGVPGEKGIGQEWPAARRIALRDFKNIEATLMDRAQRFGPLPGTNSGPGAARRRQQLSQRDTAGARVGAGRMVYEPAGKVRLL